MKGLGRSAKTLSEPQLRSLIRHVESETRYPERNRVIVLLSFRAGLRAKEIACVTWRMVTDAGGSTLSDGLALENTASKGKRGGRVIPIHAELRSALEQLQRHEIEAGRYSPIGFVAHLGRGNSDPQSRANTIHYLFNKAWFPALGMVGASSHSGRRSFITQLARKTSLVGASLRDVQALAGHASLSMTQRYVDTDPEAMRKLIDRL